MEWWAKVISIFVCSLSCWSLEAIQSQSLSLSKESPDADGGGTLSSEMLLCHFCLFLFVLLLKLIIPPVIIPRLFLE